jgi:hypothetical protein
MIFFEPFWLFGNSLDKETKRRRRFNAIKEFWEALAGLGEDGVREKLARADYEGKKPLTIVLAHSFFLWEIGKGSDAKSEKTSRY